MGMLRVLCVALSVCAVFALTAEEELCLSTGSTKPNCAKVQCAQHTHCDTCSKDLRCGWGASDGICIPGVAAGPTSKGTNCSTWDFAFCSSLPCASHTSCDSCAADALCGWCSTSNVCVEGSMRGPVFMACVLRDWLHEPKMCPVRPANCPCPNPDGSCPTSANCDRNNHIGHTVTPGDDLDPESLDDTKWYDSVADQIPIDVVVPDLMTVPPEGDADPSAPPANVPL